MIATYALIIGMLMSIALMSAVVLYETNNKKSARVFITALIFLVGISSAGTLYMGSQREEMYEAARRQGIVIVIDRINNDAIAILPCVFDVEYIPAAEVLVFAGTGTPALELDAEEHCKAGAE